MMEKGKIKNKEKHISVLFVPHFSANVKSIKFSAPYTKIIAAVILITVLTISMLLLTVLSIIENKKLKTEKEVLSNLNTEQHKLLQEKAEEVKGLITKENQFNSKAKDFMEKYREITDNYLKGAVKPNRSGESSTRSFVSDIKDLKVLLEDINELSNSKDVIYDDLSAIEEELNEYMDTVPTLWPASGAVSSDFGERKDPFVWRKSFHTGIDIAASYGSKIKAAASGKVILAKKISVYGRAVTIDHGHGITTFYGHASKLLVKEGQTVEKGDVIAYVGSSGRSTGAHLHFEVRINNTSVNPLKYLSSK